MDDLILVLDILAHDFCVWVLEYVLLLNDHERTLNIRLLMNDKHTFKVDVGLKYSFYFVHGQYFVFASAFNKIEALNTLGADFALTAYMALEHIEQA